MFGSNRLYTAINIDSVTGLVDAFGSGHAIFPSTLIPESFTGNEVINFYRTGTNGFGLGYHDYTYNINCRSELEIDSLIMANAVKDAINRVAVENGFTYCRDILQTIPPQDETDLYNTPVTVTIKSK